MKSWPGTIVILHHFSFIYRMAKRGWTEDFYFFTLKKHCRITRNRTCRAITDPSTVTPLPVNDLSTDSYNSLSYICSCLLHCTGINTQYITTSVHVIQNDYCSGIYIYTYIVIYCAVVVFLSSHNHSTTMPLCVESMFPHHPGHLGWKVNTATGPLV